MCAHMEVKQKHKIMNYNFNINFLQMGPWHLPSIKFFSSCNYKLPNKYLFNDSNQKKVDLHHFTLQWECGGLGSPIIILVEKLLHCPDNSPMTDKFRLFFYLKRKRKRTDLNYFLCSNPVIILDICSSILSLYRPLEKVISHFTNEETG